MTTPLFASPFTSTGYGNTYGTSPSQQQQQPDSGAYLRRSENDAFVTMSPPPPGVQRRRIRRRQLQSPDSWVQTAMRMVLLSPVIVLVVWSIAAMLFTRTQTVNISKQQQQQKNNNKSNNNNNNNHYRIKTPEGLFEVVEVFEHALGSTNSKQKQQTKRRMIPLGSTRQSSGMRKLPISDGGQLIAYSPLGASSSATAAPTSTQDEQQFLPPILPPPLAGAVQPQQDFTSLSQLQQQNYLGVALQQEQGYLSATEQAPPQGVAVQQQQGYLSTTQDGATYFVPVPPLGAASTNRNTATIVRPRPGPKPRMEVANSISSNAMMATNDGRLLIVQPASLATQSSKQSSFTAAPTTANYPVIPPPPPPHALPLDAPALNMSDPVMQQQQLLGEAAPPLMQRSQPQTTVLYYRPADVMSSDGQMVLPAFVYDAYGRAIPTAALLNAAQVYLEPPLGATTSEFRHGQHHVHDLNQINPFARGDVEPDQFRSLAQDSQQRNKFASAATDQSILVCTVGVVALIIGALSARKLRHSGSWLSVCMENETLEQDAVYDTAYTVDDPYNQQEGYHTFGWKQDLEKFDV